MEAVFPADAGELQRAFHHAQRRIAVAVHDAVAEGTVVGPDTHGTAEAFAFEDERGEALLDARQFGGVGLVGVFLDGELLRVGVVAGIDADLLDPLHRFHRGVRLEMDVGDDGDVATDGMEFADDVLKVRGVLNGGRGDADDLAADGDEFQRLLHAQRCVHRVAGQHGLLHNGMGAADDDSALGGITDDDLAAEAAAE